MTDRFGPVRGRAGQVYQAGLDIHDRAAAPAFGPRQGPYRAVVLNTYVTDSEGSGHRQLAQQVSCDVILVRSGFRLNHVPVAQPVWGENDARVWVPKESTRVISQNTALNATTLRSPRGSFQGSVTHLDDLDGDTVLLDFVEGSITHPLIIGSLPHEQTRRIVVEGVGHAEGPNGEDDRGKVYRREAYFRHAGTEARVSGTGDVLLDTVGATDDRVQEDPAAGASSGHVRVRLKENRRLTVEIDGTDVLEVWQDGNQVRIDLGEGAGQRLVLGDDFRAFLNDWLSDVFENHQHLAGTLVGSVPVTGQTGGVAPSAIPVPPALPIVPMPQFLGSQMNDDLLSDLARTKKT